MTAVERAMSGVTEPTMFLTPHETGALVGLSRGQLHDLRRAGEGPAYFTIGAAVRYRPADVDEWRKQRDAPSRGRQR